MKPPRIDTTTMGQSKLFDRMQKVCISLLWVSWALIFAVGQHRNHERALQSSGEWCNPGPDLGWSDHTIMLWLALGAVCATLWLWRFKPLRAASFGLACLYLWATLDVVLGDEARGHAPCTIHGDEGLINLGVALGGALFVSLLFIAMIGLLAHVAKRLPPG